MTYRYFVSYSYYVDNSLLNGNIEIKSDRRIENFEDIEQIAKKIKENNKLEIVIILNFQLLSINK